MKKVFLMSLCLLLAMLCLVSCASLKSYEKNLGSNYDVYELDEDDIEDYGDNYDLDIDDYKIKKGIEAEHEDKGYSVLILQCGSSKKAEELENDLKKKTKYYEIERDGKFVLIGSEKAVKKALGK